MKNPPQPELFKALPVKKLVSEQMDHPRRIDSVTFGLLSPAEIMRLSELEVYHREMYQAGGRDPTVGGVLDLRMGTSNKAVKCETCQQNMATCPGHFGFIRLELPVLHIGYHKATMVFLQMICKSCARVLLPDDEKLGYLQQLRDPANAETLRRRHVFKDLHDRCKKESTCRRCGAINGAIRKSGALKILHEPFKDRKKYVAERSHRVAEMSVGGGGPGGTSSEADVERFARTCGPTEDLNPLRVLELFQRLPQEDVELLDQASGLGHPSHLVITHLLVPPVCIRPSVAMDAAQGSNEDDLTMKLHEILHINNALRAAMQKGQTSAMLIEDWEYLQLQVGVYYNSELPGVPSNMAAAKPIRGFCQRLKGKSGRFRGNLSGKRVDFSGRAVISPDPNLRVNEVAVPPMTATTLSYPEQVTEHNLAQLQQYVRNGPDQWPGANYVQKSRDGHKQFLRYGDREHTARNLKPNDIVERHVMDGDYVLFNRQPSLHKLSIMCHRLRVLEGPTFRFNESVCNPFNADFDGDEMNLHVPQTEEARGEAAELMGVVHNLVTPRNGSLIVGAIQDFITASFLMTSKDRFFSRAEFQQVCCEIWDAEEHLDIPAPAIVYPVELWTGKQVFSMLMRPNKNSMILVNTVLEGKMYGRQENAKEMCVRDGYVVVRNSHHLCGRLDKASLGGGGKSGLFYTMITDFSPEVAADRMTRLARMCARWIGDQGFSIGISDVMPSDTLVAKKTELIANGKRLCDEAIAAYERGQLQPRPGCTVEETLEAEITGTLSRIRSQAGDMCISELDVHTNSPLIMALSGSKGSNINISQMISCVGQQTLSGARVPEGFVRRTLPHFYPKSRLPAAKGFVENSFFDGMTPTEMFFHTMGGREGLVDTAVKTAETGYMQRRLMKALEDIAVHYDSTVRNAVGDVVQFNYGDDDLDPTHMEGRDRPVNFGRLIHTVQARFPYTGEPVMRADDVRAEVTRFVEELWLSTRGSPATDISSFFLARMTAFFAGIEVLGDFSPEVRSSMSVPTGGKRHNKGARPESGDSTDDEQDDNNGDDNMDTDMSQSVGGRRSRRSSRGASASSGRSASAEAAAAAAEAKAQVKREQQEQKHREAVEEAARGVAAMDIATALADVDMEDEAAVAAALRSTLSQVDECDVGRRRKIGLEDVRSKLEDDGVPTLAGGDSVCKRMDTVWKSLFVVCGKEDGTVLKELAEIYRTSVLEDDGEYCDPEEIVRFDEARQARDQEWSDRSQSLSALSHSSASVGRGSVDMGASSDSAGGDGAGDQPMSRRRRRRLMSMTEGERLAGLGVRYTRSTEREEIDALGLENSVFKLSSEGKQWAANKVAELRAAQLRSCNDHELAVLSVQRSLSDGRLTPSQLRMLLEVMVRKYRRARMEPGTAVGALGAQSIGEPGTQMTLKTFHFAGVASMNVTLGVPRIKEIINASRNISTPIITATLLSENDLRAARIVKGRVETTTLGQVLKRMVERYTPTKVYLRLELDCELLERLMIDVSAESVKKAILGDKRTRVSKDNVFIVHDDDDVKVLHVHLGREKGGGGVDSGSASSAAAVAAKKAGLMFKMQSLQASLPQVVISGIPTVSRAVINRKEKDEFGRKYTDQVERYNLLIEGSGLQQVMATDGVDGTRTRSNHIIEVDETLGIEAARWTIVEQIIYTMNEHGMSLDQRHVMLLADLMTFRGTVLGITRFGIEKWKESVFALASFEKTTDHLFAAAVAGRTDNIVGVSEAIIVGSEMPLGTGMFRTMFPAGNVGEARDPPSSLWTLPGAYDSFSLDPAVSAAVGAE